MRTSPSPTLITLGRLVRRYRDAGSILQADLAKRLGYSDGWLSNVETGQLRPRREQVAAIEQALEVPPGVLLEVFNMLEGESLPGWMRDWLAEERRSSALRAFELAVVPGLLQTPDYARTVLDGDEAAVTARLDRQAILKSENPPTLRCVLDETVLTRGFGDAAVMRDQLEHLVNCVSPRLAVQIVPSGVRYEGLAGAFTIATVNGGDVAYIDTVVRGLVTSNPEDIACLIDVWESIRTFALSQRESIELIKKVAEERWT
ncbi:helix-turn-helix domain-containing protein [Actinoallomurus soli]|uniref:helix-turn-helix domain-containing protein n=1 Tax=Actinoallomurus soli TaxID=2952535 RepID=UPI00209240B4|nr:helix-turn-helix transcriptional regulator [Actinoallomurus soli]MCO5972791.1 helix-turn-helix domain-containing protein [Actinoallomurus soli]